MSTSDFVERPEYTLLMDLIIQGMQLIRDALISAERPLPPDVVAAIKLMVSLTMTRKHQELADLQQKLHLIYADIDRVPERLIGDRPF